MILHKTARNFPGVAQSATQTCERKIYWHYGTNLRAQNGIILILLRSFVAPKAGYERLSTFAKLEKDEYF